MSDLIEKKNTPELRYKNFNSDWKSSKLIDLAQDGFSNGVFNDPAKVGSGYKLINVKDMYVGDQIDTAKLTLLDLPLRDFEKNRVKYGDIFFTRSSLVKSGIAWSNVMLSNSDDITYDGHLIKMSLDVAKIDPYFFSKVLRTQTLRHQIVARGKTGTMTTIGQDDMSSVVAYIPELFEQQKIAAALQSVDDKLTQLRHKQQLLQTYKRGIMQKIFTQQLRFKQDDGRPFPDWEVKKLGELFSGIKSGRDKPNSETGFPVYGSRGVIGFSETYSYEGDQILVARVGANAGSLNYVDGKYSVTDNTLILGGIQQVNIRFVYAILEVANLERMVFGSGQPLITGSQLKQLIIGFPSLPEQHKIADFLTAIDTKIDAVTQQITQIETFKKGLLQKMFV
jgi:type I restriction enzyme S subunit